MQYRDYILSADENIVREVQTYCANLHDDNRTRVHPDRQAWGHADAVHIAALLNKSDDPINLFRFMDEKTGSSYVGYRTQDGREWFHILRQMRNTRDSGLLENLKTRA